MPLLSAGNWGGAGLHLRGNVEGYLGAGSAHKYLQIHVGDHVGPFYSLEGRLVQLRFLEQFLRGVDTGITREPPIRLAIRRDDDRYRWRYENEWPLARTQWTEQHLDASALALATERAAAASTVSFGAEPDAAQSNVRFATAPFEREIEVTGPIKLRLWVSSTGDDADLFAIVRNLRPDGSEVTVPGTAAVGWEQDRGRRTAGCASRTASSTPCARRRTARTTRTTRSRRCARASRSRSRSRSCRPASCSSAGTGWCSRSARRTTRTRSSSTTSRATGFSSGDGHDPHGRCVRLAPAAADDPGALSES